MKISTGIIVILVGIAVFCFGCFAVELLYPKPQKLELCTWYGEIHWEIPYVLPPEYNNPYDPNTHYPQQEPKDDKSAE